MIRALPPLLLSAAWLACGAAGCHRDSIARTGGLVIQRPDPAPDVSPQERRERYAKLYQRGLELAERGDPGAALPFFEEARKYDPDSIDAMLALGACYESIGDPVRAIGLYRAVIRINPDCAEAYANLGTSYIKLYYRERNPRWKELARESWQRSLAIRPAQTDVQAYLADVDAPRPRG
ncbi:MAG: tetratricopeptide repeat protein [Phycisphaerae bacterium]|nr:tetratricopeptide repeat protein [Phycisphaerae bacterium]